MEIAKPARWTADCLAQRQRRSPERTTLLRLLNGALATQIVGMLRCRRHYYITSGSAADSVRQVFLQHAHEQLTHADHIAARIVQLRGEPDLNPRGLTERSHAEYIAADSLESMIREDLVAQRIAIDSYRQVIGYVGTRDRATQQLMEEVLARAEERAAALANLLQGVRIPCQVAQA